MLHNINIGDFLVFYGLIQQIRNVAHIHKHHDAALYPIDNLACTRQYPHNNALYKKRKQVEHRDVSKRKL